MIKDDGCIADYYDPDHSIRNGDHEHEPGPIRWLRASEIEPFLRQKKVWRNKDNEEIPLDEIDTRYAQNIVRFLERGAHSLLDAVVASRMYAEAMTDCITSDPKRFGDQDPVEWMRKRPLYKALLKKSQT